jgi:hypothetical protein
MLIQFCFKPKSANKRETVVPAPHRSPPRACSVCTNVDATLFPSEQLIGWGAVLRDHIDAFILSCSEGFSDFHDPEVRSRRAGYLEGAVCSL